MPASLSGVYNLQVLTNTGAPAASFRLYTLVQGSTTQKTAWTDATASVAHAYVSDGAGGIFIQLNARGELPAPLFLTSGAYDIALKDPAGASVWTRYARGQDDQSDTLRADLASAASGKGASLVSMQDAGSYFTTDNVEAALQQLGTAAFRAPWYITKDSAVLMSLRHATSGNIVQQWQDGTSGTATYFYRGLSIQTDSHSVQMGPATNGGSCDLMWQRSTLNADPAGNRFNITFEETTDRLLLSYATSASGAPVFDSAIQLYAGTSPQLLFPGIVAQFNQGVGVKQRAAGGFECRLVPTSSTVADLRQIGGSNTIHLRLSDNALGFFGATGTARVALPAAAVDAATTMALANAIRAALIGFGLCS